jgi:hypothetical protein
MITTIYRQIQYFHTQIKLGKRIILCSFTFVQRITKITTYSNISYVEFQLNFNRISSIDKLI